MPTTKFRRSVAAPHREARPAFPRRCRTSAEETGPGNQGRDDFSSSRHALYLVGLSMIFSENREPLFGIMLQGRAAPGARRPPALRASHDGTVKERGSRTPGTGSQFFMRQLTWRPARRSLGSQGLPHSGSADRTRPGRAFARRSSDASAVSPSADPSSRRSSPAVVRGGRISDGRPACAELPNQPRASRARRSRSPPAAGAAPVPPCDASRERPPADGTGQI